MVQDNGTLAMQSEVSTDGFCGICGVEKNAAGAGSNIVSEQERQYRSA